MAARLRKLHQDDVRAKIKTSQLVNRLEDHALNNVELSATQIKAIEVLIRKTLPDLTSVQADIEVHDDRNEGDIDSRIAALQARIGLLAGTQAPTGKPH